ncbi:hypothetical protein PQR57_13540 [Paraburkholderia dipogonis]|uniref:DUF4303 domain-containing protein n=1 Tax=Paraburkholderia dipogonis TaxID=1211383 RepID=A0ABW9ART5_9BURK
MSARELEERFTRIEKAAEESGSFVVTSVLANEGNETYRISMELEPFVALLKHCRPPVLYVFADKFDARQTFEAWWEIDGEDAEDAALMAEPRVRQMIRQASRFESQIGTVLASFFVGNVLHSCFEQADWLTRFEEEAEELEAQLVEERRRRENGDLAREDTERRTYAKTLCEHPTFNEGRPSREKRIYLAESLFPDLDRMMILRIVDEAANMHWMNSK